MIDDDNIALPARTGPDRLLSPLERLAETSEAEIWLQKQKSAPLRNLAAVLDFFHFQQLGWK
jgi:hypothetical protein